MNEPKWFLTSEPCDVGFGVKWHIRGKRDWTLCGAAPGEDIITSLISVREDYEEICKNCLREYHKSQKRK